MRFAKGDAKHYFGIDRAFPCRGETTQFVADRRSVQDNRHDNCGRKPAFSQEYKNQLD